MAKARLIGINHVALEVGDLEKALEVYGELFEFELRGRVPGMAFLDMGDQFLAFSEGRSAPPDEDRHFGLVVDDPDSVREGAEAAGFELVGGRGVNLRDPWGNLLEIVAYSEVQFERPPGVKRKLGIETLGKSDPAIAEIEERGLS